MDPSSPTQIKRSHSISECEVIIPRTRRSARALPAPEALEVIVTIVCDGRDSVLHNIKPSLTLANLLSSWCTDQVLDIEDMDFRCGGDYITSTDCDVLEKRYHGDQQELTIQASQKKDYKINLRESGVKTSIDIRNNEDLLLKPLAHFGCEADAINLLYRGPMMDDAHTYQNVELAHKVNKNTTIYVLR